MAVRELDKHELIVVAGGLWYQDANGEWFYVLDSVSVTPPADEYVTPPADEYMDSITVTAPEGYEAPMEPYQSPNYIPDEYDAWDVGDDQSGAISTAEIEGYIAIADEEAIDELAQSLAAQIMAMPDWQQREYVAVIYKLPDGTVVATALHAGLLNGTATDATKAALLEAGGVANLGNIVGIIHNHPYETLVKNNENPDLAADIEKMPSDSDWNTVEAYFNDRTDFALYLVGPDGELREYESSDRAIWETRNDPSYYNRHEGRYDNWLDSEQGVNP